MRRLRVFLDANVLVDAQVRDLILRAAETGLVDIRWSRRVLDETRRRPSPLHAEAPARVITDLDGPDPQLVDIPQRAPS